MFILNKSIINNIDNIKSKILNPNDIIVGNYLFLSLNSRLCIKDSDYEIYSLKTNNINNIVKIMKNTNNHICFFKENLYVDKYAYDIINFIHKNNYSDEYNDFLYQSLLKKHYDIFNYIEKLDINNFNSIVNNEYNIIKYIDNQPLLPINYCNKLMKTTVNKIALQILNEMYKILINYNYEIHYDIYENNDKLFNFMILCLRNNDILLFLKLTTLFKLNYTNDNFISVLIKNNHKLDVIIDEMQEKNIYSNNNDYIYLLLILNKVNRIQQFDINTIDINIIIPYLHKYNSLISFYYLCENKIDIINTTVCRYNINFLKIYVHFANIDKIFEYLKIHICDNDYLDEIIYMIQKIDALDINKIKQLLLILFMSMDKQNNDNIIIKKIFELDFNKKLLLDHELVLHVILKKNEELFYYLMSFLTHEEQNNLLSTVITTNEIDCDGNTLYHYICMQNLCIGLCVNNKIRNNKGFKPLDLCKINTNYYGKYKS